MELITGELITGQQVRKKVNKMERILFNLIKYAKLLFCMKS